MTDNYDFSEEADMIQQAARSQRPENSGRAVTEAGFQARQISDGDMDGSWRSRASAGSGGGLMQVEEEAFSRQQVLRARRVIEESGGLSMDDLISLSMSDADGNSRQAARDLRRMSSYVQQAPARPNQNLYETDYGMDDSMSSGDTWVVVRKNAKLANSNRSIPVFVVEDSLSGMTTGKKYRLEVIAERIARVINTTGNPDDPRVQMIDQNYDRHVKLMQAIGAHKKSLREGKSMDRNKLSRLETELQQVNAKLGLD